MSYVKKTSNIDKDYLKMLMDKGLLSVGTDKLDGSKSFLYTDSNFSNIISYLNENHIPIVSCGDGYFKAALLELPSFSLSDKEAKELDKAYRNFNLTATGRTFYVDIGGVRVDGFEYIYNGEKYVYGHSISYSGDRYSRWYKVEPVDFVIDNNKFNVLSDRPVVDSEANYESVRIDVDQQLYYSSKYKGKSEEFNIKNSEYNIKNGVLYGKLHYTEIVPYGVSKIVLNSENKDNLTVFLVIPDTVSSMEFSNGSNSVKPIYTNHLELYDNIEFGLFVQFIVRDEVVIHYSGDSLLDFMDRLSKILVKGTWNKNKIQRVFEGNKLKVILRGNGLSKNEKNKIKNRFSCYKIAFVDEEAVKKKDNMLEAPKEEEKVEEKSERQKKIDDLSTEIGNYLSYYSDGEKRKDELRKGLEALFFTLDDIVNSSNDDKTTEEVLRDADDIYKQIIELLEREKKQLVKYSQYYEIIDYADLYNKIVLRNATSCDDEFGKKLIGYINKASKLDNNMYAMIGNMIRTKINNEIQQIQEYYENQYNGVSSIPPHYGDKDGFITYLNEALSEEFKQIDDATEAKSVLDDMQNDLFDAVQKNFDDAKREYKKYFKVTANKISANIKNKVGNNEKLFYYLDERGNIVNFFLGYDTTKSSKEFAKDLMTNFPQLFKSEESVKSFEKANVCSNMSLVYGNPELEKLLIKYSYFTQALMILESNLDTELERLKQLQAYSGLRMGNFGTRK